MWQTEFENNEHFSATRAANVTEKTGNGNVTVYPNPVGSAFTIKSNPAPVAAIQLTAMTGKTEWHITNPSVMLPIPKRLANEQYMVDVIYINGESARYTILIKRSTMAAKKNITWAVVYFILATVLTGIFIANKFWFYNSVNQMILSGTIAGAKWLIQIIAALIFLKEKKWEFIKRIGFVCFIGSCLLFLYNILWYLPLPFGGFSLFVLSILLSVLVMIMMYYRAVQKTRLPLKWFLLWLVCLSVAVFLQVKVVFVK